MKAKRPVHPQDRSQGHQRPLLPRRNLRLQWYLQIFFTTEPEERSTKPLSVIVHEEVTSYKATGCISVDEDSLAWWKSNEHKYPHIAKLAQCTLAVPGTCVPSERVFSTAGDIVTASRSRLLAENVEKLIFLRKNMNIK